MENTEKSRNVIIENQTAKIRCEKNVTKVNKDVIPGGVRNLLNFRCNS